MNRKTIFSLFVAVIMITSAIGMVMSYNINVTKDKQTQIKSVYEELLTPQQEISILRSGMSLIVFLHTGDDDSLQKKALYENFAARLNGFIVLEVVDVGQANQTRDEMIVPSGDVIPLQNVTEESLMDTFCRNSLLQPRECILRNV
jgi:hypothetical protein